MKSISIYAITRKQNLAQLSRMERQLSKREKPLKMREWELDSLKNLGLKVEPGAFLAWVALLYSGRDRSSCSCLI